MNKNAFIMGIIWICVALAGTFFLIKGLTMNSSNSGNKGKWRNSEIVKDFMEDDEGRVVELRFDRVSAC